jgi:hypothetical protein
MRDEDLHGVRQAQRGLDQHLQLDRSPGDPLPDLAFTDQRVEDVDLNRRLDLGDDQRCRPRRYGCIKIVDHHVERLVDPDRYVEVNGQRCDGVSERLPSCRPLTRGDAVLEVEDDGVGMVPARPVDQFRTVGGDEQL